MNQLTSQFSEDVIIAITIYACATTYHSLSATIILLLPPQTILNWNGTPRCTFLNHRSGVVTKANGISLWLLITHVGCYICFLPLSLPSTTFNDHIWSLVIYVLVLAKEGRKQMEKEKKKGNRDGILDSLLFYTPSCAFF